MQRRQYEIGNAPSRSFKSMNRLRRGALRAHLSAVKRHRRRAVAGFSQAAGN